MDDNDVKIMFALLLLMSFGLLILIHDAKRYFRRELSAYRTEMVNKIERIATQKGPGEAQGAPATGESGHSIKREKETWMVLPADSTLPPGITPAQAIGHQFAMERAWDEGYWARGKGASNPYRKAEGVDNE